MTPVCEDVTSIPRLPWSIECQCQICSLWLPRRFIQVKTHGLTLNVREPSYLSLTRSKSWLMMPWLLASPGHRQPWYWLFRIGRSMSYLRKDFNYLCHINVIEWHKMSIYVCAPSEKFSRKRVNSFSYRRCGCDFKCVNLKQIGGWYLEYLN